jgi:hypothetical protein
MQADRDAQAVVLYLADRDVPCPGCGYNLPGGRADQVPGVPS